MLTRPPKVHPPRRPVREGVVELTSIPYGRGLSSAASREPVMRTTDVEILTYSHVSLAHRMPALTEFVRTSGSVVPLSRHPAWLNVLQTALGHEPYVIEATAAGQTVGFLPLAFLDTILFGKFLVSLPYLNSNGILASCPMVQNDLVARAVLLADELNVRYLELRHETSISHPGLSAAITSKVHMRLALPSTADQLWKEFDPKVRNQVRKGEKHDFALNWGGEELLAGFYAVLSRNMRDLGSPVYGIELFRGILRAFPRDAEICLVRSGNTPIAAAMLLHGWGVTEVPTASSLKEYNPTSVNMLMYWHLLKRALERNQLVFDFGRSTTEGTTFKFKRQWGAEPSPAIWQYHVNRGEVGEMRPDNPRYQRAIRIWQNLPVAVTRLIGPRIVRGIP